MNPNLSPEMSRHRSDARAASTLGRLLAASIVLATVICVIAPPLVAGIAVFGGLGTMGILAYRAARMEQASAPGRREQQA